MGRVEEQPQIILGVVDISAVWMACRVWAGHFGYGYIYTFRDLEAEN